MNTLSISPTGSPVQLADQFYDVPREGLVWNAHNLVVRGSGSPRSWYINGGTRFTYDPSAKPRAMLTVQGIGTKFQDLGFWGGHDKKTFAHPGGFSGDVDRDVVGVSVQLKSGTGQMRWENIAFRGLKAGFEFGGEGLNNNCDLNSFAHCAFKACDYGLWFRQSQSCCHHAAHMDFYDVGTCYFIQQGGAIEANTTDAVGCDVVVQCEQGSNCYFNIFSNVKVDGRKPAAGRTVLYKQETRNYTRNCFDGVQYESRQMLESKTPMIRTAGGAYLVIRNSTIPALNLVERTEVGPDLPAIVIFDCCNFHDGQFDLATAFPNIHGPLMVKWYGCTHGARLLIDDGQAAWNAKGQLIR